MEDEVKPEIVAAWWIGVGVAVLASVIASVFSYRLGKRQNRNQDLHARRVEVTTTIRGKIQEISAVIEGIIAHYEHYELGEEVKRLIEVRIQNIGELEEYYKSNEPWLTQEASRVVEASVADGHILPAAFARLSARGATSGAIYEPDIAELREIADKFRTHLAELDKEVRKVVGTQRPWWRRIFGR